METNTKLIISLTVNLFFLILLITLVGLHPIGDLILSILLLASGFVSLVLSYILRHE